MTREALDAEATIQLDAWKARHPLRSWRAFMPRVVEGGTVVVRLCEASIYEGYIAEGRGSTLTEAAQSALGKVPS